MLWEMSQTDWIISAAFFSCITYVTAYVADRILLTTGFGTIGNWLLLLVGCYSGLLSVNLYGHELHWNPPVTIAAVVLASAGVLMSLCLVKRVFRI